MASLQQRISETQRYFIENWTETPFMFEGKKPELDTKNLEKYIRFAYTNYDNQIKNMGRELAYGTFTVYCYHRNRTQCAILSDSVSNFFKCKDLPNGIRTDVGVQGNILELDNKFFLNTVQFDIRQFA